VSIAKCLCVILQYLRFFVACPCPSPRKDSPGEAVSMGLFHPFHQGKRTRGREYPNISVSHGSIEETCENVDFALQQTSLEHFANKAEA
ncbi:hypothetical protein E2I00_007322, partial [Balaenoptera physalus]